MNSVKDVLSLKCMQASLPFKKRIEAIETFKTQISENLDDLCQRADRVKFMFKEFSSSGDPRIKSRPDLSGGLDLYFDMYSNSKMAILKTLDDEVAFCNQRISEMQSEKNALV